MNKYKKIVLLGLICSIGFASGCRCDATSATGSGFISSGRVDVPINPGNEDFEYITSNRTVDDDIITITFQYRLVDD